MGRGSHPWECFWHPRERGEVGWAEPAPILAAHLRGERQHGQGWGQLCSPWPGTEGRGREAAEVLPALPGMPSKRDPSRRGLCT